MVHSSLYWKYHGLDDISIWSFLLKHSIWLNNSLPNYRSGTTPLELLTINKADHRSFRRSHIWGCLVFVLDPKLQNDQKILKWDR